MAEVIGELPWFALFVRINHEKLVSAALRTKGFEQLLPLYQTRRRWSDRIKQIHSPIFPGYVFSRFNLEHRLPILTIPGVHTIVGNGKIPVPVEQREIENLKLIVESQIPAEPWPYMKVGETVRIEYGVLDGLEGILVSKKPQRVVVSVALLQRSVAVEIDQAWIRPVNRMTRVAAQSKAAPVRGSLPAYPG